MENNNDCLLAPPLGISQSHEAGGPSCLLRLGVLGMLLGGPNIFKKEVVLDVLGFCRKHKISFFIFMVRSGWVSQVKYPWDSHRKSQLILVPSKCWIVHGYVSLQESFCSLMFSGGLLFMKMIEHVNPVFHQKFHVSSFTFRVYLRTFYYIHGF